MCVLTPLFIPNYILHMKTEITHRAIHISISQLSNKLFSVYQIFAGTSSPSVPASFAIVSTISIGSSTCHFADVILFAPPTVVGNIASGEIAFAFRNCRNISDVNNHLYKGGGDTLIGFIVTSTEDKVEVITHF